VAYCVSIPFEVASDEWRVASEEERKPTAKALDDCPISDCTGCGSYGDSITPH